VSDTVIPPLFPTPLFPLFSDVTGGITN
jgi:hypothetical protein